MQEASKLVAFSSDSPGPKSRPNAYAPGPHLPEVLGETTGPLAQVRCSLLLRPSLVKICSASKKEI